VSSSTDATNLRVSFDYTGGPAPTVTVGTGPDVYGTQVTWSSATQYGDRHRWGATVPGLTPGTLYYFRINNGAFSAFGSATTWHRDVVVDFYQVDIFTDGDSWPSGCGDFFFSFFADDRNDATGEICLDDGAHLTRADWRYGEGQGHFTFTDWKRSSIPVQFWALDLDAKGQPSNCGGVRMTTCGDLAYGFRDWATDANGTTYHTLSVTGEGVNASARATVTVSSHP
jgi:hypothetical protein